MHLWIEKAVCHLICASSHNLSTSASGLRRKKCCHPVHQGDLFKYMSTLIKISNHLALILPCEFIKATHRYMKLSACISTIGYDGAGKS